MIENLSVETVIIVACVCGSVVLILSIVLIVLCCQRHRKKDLYEKTETKTPDAATGEDPSSPPSHPPQQQHLQQQHLVQEDCNRDVALPQALKDCDNVRVSYRASNPTLANYPSLDRGTINSSTHPMNSMTSAAAAADDKRPRKVIYEVIV